MESYWQAHSTHPRFATLREAQEFDVAIIGGGITGLTAAFALKQAGLRVCVLERSRVGGGETSYTSAHLAFATDLRLPELVETMGEEGARRVWEAGAVAIDAIEGIVEQLQIDCDFHRVPGFLHAAIGGRKDERNELRDEAELAARLGFSAEFVQHSPILDKPAVRYANQARFHPLYYVTALAKAIHGEGCVIFENAEVTEVHDDPLVVKANDCSVACKYVVIATHVPLQGKSSLISATLFQTKQYPYSTYCVGANVPHGTLPDALYWDTHDPYHYMRIMPGRARDYVIFGGEDHKTGQKDDTEGCYQRLEKTLHRLLPLAKVDRRWSGQVIETNDGLPYIGETSEHQFVAGGFSGNGLTFGTIAGLMARDAVLGATNPWQEIFATDRTKFWGGTWDYVKENASYPYYLIGDWLTAGEHKSTRSIKRGEGKILMLDGDRVACHRDEEGKLSMCSPVCTHMGCLVRFNNAEQTWDCPCHGSRFKPNGEVLGGPAELPLEKIEKVKPVATKIVVEKI